MKRITILLALSVIIIGNSFAQGLSYGVKGGLNIANVSTSKFETDAKSGFHAGVFVKFNAILLGVQPELLFSQKGASYTADGMNADARYNYIDIPVMLQIKIFPAISLDLGPQYSILVSQKTETAIETPSGVEKSTSTSTDGYKTSELGGAIGITATLLKIGASARYTMAFSDLGDDIEARNNVFQLSAFIKF